MKPKLYPLNKRKSKVNIKQFAKLAKIKDFSCFLNSVPDILAGQNLKLLVKRIKEAQKKRKTIIFTYGAHFIKCGLSPLLIDLIKRGFVSCLATNGAGIIHDFEIAFCGKTSEDVAENLKKGMFGMAEETGFFINQACQIAYQNNLGLGRALGELISKERLKYRNLSPVYWAYKKKIPFCVFVGIGTDITHQHPQAEGASIGASSFKDFHKFKEVVATLEGGAIINFGSAVIIPEVFLKALNLARNLGFKVRNFTTVNFDTYTMYRAYQNIVNRPTGGKGFYFIGHHEIMFPLLYQLLISS
ncbi:MAG TPA: hypothetical protein ENI31_06950 [Candidatus Omnitrophica bacterium]|nr:MAG: hypothetical protein DRP69_00810 [Candidatus Omnitrophota bacterium]RKY45037.1 MAG: hypothetical protein DRP80_00350 [Candidatus Omnitrophota bacterium]HEC70001.1 hypothetical protein [Candidatus Omnitrophota bacterium]